MASFNLVRNSRVFFTTNVNNVGKVGVANDGTTPVACTTANSQEIQVMDGFSFSQASNADTINISEAGNTPVRGQRSFNTSLANVEFSFSTYIRPRLSTTVKAEEAVLWNALLSSATIGGTVAFTAVGITTASVAIDAAGILTIPGTGMTVNNLTVGEVYVLKGVGGLGANEYNTAIRILTASATSITGQMLVKPAAAVAPAGWSAAVTMTKSAWNENVAVGADTGYTAAYSAVTTGLSNKNQLQTFGMIITVDGVTYAIDNCAMDQAVIDFGLDGIAMVAWTGKGTALRQLASNVIYSAVQDPVLTGGLTGTITGKITTANYITNKLSSVSLIKNIGGQGANNFTYNLALTGGSITIANNITYVTPANLGVVNVPIGYFTGTRAITGSLTAYLRTGNAVGAANTGNTTGTLLNDLLAASATSAGTEPKFAMVLDIGGSAASTRVNVDVPGAMLQIPSIDAQAVMSTTINFTAQGSDAAQSATTGYDIESTNELELRYFSI